VLFGDKTKGVYAAGDLRNVRLPEYVYQGCPLEEDAPGHPALTEFVDIVEREPGGVCGQHNGWRKSPLTPAELARMDLAAQEYARYIRSGGKHSQFSYLAHSGNRYASLASGMSSEVQAYFWQAFLDVYQNGCPLCAPEDRPGVGDAHRAIGALYEANAALYAQGEAIGFYQETFAAICSIEPTRDPEYCSRRYDSTP
jgi:hypothetical protein